MYDKYNDIKQGQSNGNYQYDAIGNVISDASEGITDISWNVYGTIESITKSSGTILYTYDAAGNRISKTANSKTTWYARDASGNVMSVYTKDNAVNGGDLTQSEAHLYGSSRLGIFYVNRNVEHPVESEDGIYIFTRGNKFFELSNHLGNVWVTVSDRKDGVDTNSNGIIDYYMAHVVNANDYYPFGMQMPGRRYADNDSYRYGFNGKENDNDVKGEGNQQDYGMRIYDTRLGKFLSVDPLSPKYPWYTPYQFAGNRPIEATDIDGLEPDDASLFPAGIPAGMAGPNVLFQSDGDINNGLPWYYRKNMYGGKPVLTFGLGNLGTAERWEYGDHPWWSDQAIITFLHNSLVSGWNGVANTWNEGMNGKTGTDMLVESIHNIEKTKLSDFKKVETWENIFGAVITAYIVKRVGAAYGTYATEAEAATVGNRIAYAKDFYVKQGFSEAKALQHIEGINITKKVMTTILKKGTVIQQWVGQNGVGDYYTTLENGASQNLGLTDYAKRTLKQFVLTSDVEVLQSTAGEYKGAAGGGVQYFSTGIKNKIKPVGTP